jgi:nitrogen-specific signal transduction histidine kinase
MKRIIALFVVMLAFGLNANAQQKKAAAATSQTAAQQANLTKQAAYSDAAIKDIETLSQFVKLTADQKVKLKSLFEQKHVDYAQNLSAERKVILADFVETQMKSYLDPAQLTKIEGNTQLMNILTH